MNRLIYSLVFAVGLGTLPTTSAEASVATPSGVSVAATHIALHAHVMRRHHRHHHRRHHRHHRHHCHYWYHYWHHHRHHHHFRAVIVRPTIVRPTVIRSTIVLAGDAAEVERQSGTRP